jgi:serpin B
VKISIVAIFLATAGLAHCSSSSTPGSVAKSEPGESEPAKVDVVRSAQQRNTNPQLSESERDILAASRVSFAVDFYQAVRKQPFSADKDVFLSPHSISIALAMTYAGARAETAAEMKKALHFDLPDDRLHTAFDYLDLALASRGNGAGGKDGKPFRLNVASSIWGQKGSSFEMPFLDILAVNYGAGLNVVDFVKETDKSRLAINGWVEEKTENRIKEILPAGVVNGDTRMVLVNAVYFNAAWASKFDTNRTKPAPFTKADGSTVEVMMMNNVSPLPHAKGDGYEAVEMAYDGNELSMLVIAPTKGTFATFESSLTGGKVLDILASLETKVLDLSFPKLKAEGSFGLKESLRALGMRQAFEAASADFSGMSTTEKLVVQDVLHKTFVEIDENGTEAAAATAVIAANSSAPPPPPVMKIDRPFITAIIDRPTKSLLFLGRILEPKL